MNVWKRAPFLFRWCAETHIYVSRLDQSEIRYTRQQIFNEKQNLKSSHDSSVMMLKLRLRLQS